MVLVDSGLCVGACRLYYVFGAVLISIATIGLIELINKKK